LIFTTCKFGGVLAACITTVKNERKAQFLMITRILYKKRLSCLVPRNGVENLTV
jgi:hypothetical protein